MKNLITIIFFITKSTSILSLLLAILLTAYDFVGNEKICKKIKKPFDILLIFNTFTMMLLLLMYNNI